VHPCLYVLWVCVGRIVSHLRLECVHTRWSPLFLQTSQNSVWKCLPGFSFLYSTGMLADQLDSKLNVPPVTSYILAYAVLAIRTGSIENMVTIKCWWLQKNGSIIDLFNSKCIIKHALQKNFPKSLLSSEKRWITKAHVNGTSNLVLPDYSCGLKWTASHSCRVNEWSFGPLNILWCRQSYSTLYFSS
jgi:hypothetical protein